MIALPDITANVAGLTALVHARETERWARVAIVAAAIPPDADLSDDGDIIRCLFAARMCASDFLDVLDDAIERAADNRKNKQEISWS